MPDRGLTRRDLLAGAAAQALTPKRPNFLFILADDHAGYVMGADGNKQAETPNLDRLAGQSTRFAAHYCNSPVCTPSRQSFFTGQLPHAAGVTRLGTRLDENKPTLAKQFKRAGYSTAVFGKMHFNRPAEPGLHGFDHLITERELTPLWNRRPLSKPAPPDVHTKPVWRPFKDPARIWLNADELPFPRYAPDMKAQFLLQLATDYLAAKRDSPFALWVSFQEPHSPFDFPIGDERHFPASRFKPPHAGPQDASQIPLIFRDLSDADKRGIIASYYTSVGYLDRNVGALLDTLHNLGLEDDTYVVYMADHGYSLGQHGRFEKHCGYDPALRVPLMMRWPGHIRPGVVTDMTEHVDVPATITDLMRLDPLPVVHGQSLRPYLEGAEPANPRRSIFSEYLENEEAYIRTARWKFLYCTGRRKRTDGYETDNPTPGRYTRLYDLQADPDEFKDVSKENSKIVTELSALMLDRFRKTHPEAHDEPKQVGIVDSLDWYLRPRDA